MTPNEDCHCPRVKHMHGTRNNYLAHACRCTPCTNDATKERDRHRRLQAYGRPHPHKVNATPTRNHVQQLIKDGMTITEIARKANLSHPAIARIIGNGQHKPAPNILNTTANAIHAINHTTPATQGHINALGTIRRIQALAAIGYPLQQQGRLAGINPDKPRHILEQQLTDTQTAHAITNLFNRLQLTPAPPSRAATATRNRARTNGWLPPLCWDEDKIDDPKHHGYPQEVAA